MREPWGARSQRAPLLCFQRHAGAARVFYPTPSVGARAPPGIALHGVAPRSRAGGSGAASATEGGFGVSAVGNARPGSWNALLMVSPLLAPPGRLRNPRCGEHVNV